MFIKDFGILILMKRDTINITELNVGQQISATGKNSEDGDFQAQNVTIRSAQ